MDVKPEAIPKIHLSLNYGVADDTTQLVAGLLKMLTYYRVCSAFSLVRAPV
jgi:hypothetical protein